MEPEAETGRGKGAARVGGRDQDEIALGARVQITGDRLARPPGWVGLGWVASLCAMMDEKLVRFVLAPRNCFGRSQRALAGCGNRATAAPHYCALCIETLAAGQGGPTRLG